MKYDWSKERVEEAVKNSVNRSDTLRYLNIPVGGNNIATLDKRIKEYGIDASHFTGRHYVENDAAYIPYSEYENGNKKIRAFALKKKLFKEGLKEEKCEICGLTEWMGKHIVFQIHHKDGNNQNNSLDNLMILCPNCHSQTENYCGKANGSRKTNICPDCGRPILPNSRYCHVCASSHKQKIELTKEQLENDLKELKTKTAIAKKYGVSETAIRKKMKKFNL